MTKFITRVELHSASWQDYDNLHQQMEARGFSRKILANDGKYYQLPTAEYVCERNLATTNDVFALAQQAANATGKASSIITCDYTVATFNLPPA